MRSFLSCFDASIIYSVFCQCKKKTARKPIRAAFFSVLSVKQVFSFFKIDHVQRHASDHAKN